MPITRFSLALNAPENERYLVHKGVDMLALLRALAARQEPVALYFGGTDDLLRAELLGTNPAYEELLFSPGNDQGALERLLAAGSFGVEASLDSIRILFIASHAEVTRFRGQDALRARIPDVLARMQRRESVRVATPKDKPPFCMLRTNTASGGASGGTDSGQLRLQVIDISAGGLGLLLPAADAAIAPGKTCHDCSLELPGLGLMRCVLHIVYVREVQPGSKQHLAGCRFVDMPALSREQMRGYVARLERAQLAAGAR
jgi:c-di-GMP-binding flagellar brake protein YcgR